MSVRIIHRSVVNKRILRIIRAREVDVDTIVIRRRKGYAVLLRTLNLINRQLGMIGRPPYAVIHTRRLRDRTADNVLVSNVTGQRVNRLGGVDGRVCSK